MMTARWFALFLVLAFLPQVGCDDGITRRAEEHVLSRIGYGPDPWTRARIRALGIPGYIDEQLHPEFLDDAQLEADLASRYPTLSMSFPALRNVYHEYGAGNGGPSQPRLELSKAKLMRAYKSKRQLEQVLVDFWYNHFNVDARVDLARWAAAPYERDAIRPHVLGRFEDMLLATARHPAMLNYLDNMVNFTDGFVRSSRVYGLNENYAREILELHTIGVDAPYTLQDIQQVARAFTGWTVQIVLNPATDGFQYLDAGHDKGAKSIMGELFIPPGGGMEDGEAVIHYLATHPLTAQRVARKLCARFVSEPPPQALVDEAAAVFLSTDGDLRQVMATILHAPQFGGSLPHTKIKRPVAYVASVARAVGVTDELSFATNAVNEVRNMGETPYEAGPPTGYPESSAAWVSQGTFMRRVNFAFRAADAQYGFTPLGTVAGTSSQIVDQLIARLMWGGATSTTRTAAIAVVDGHNAATEVTQSAATLLASPEFLTH